MNDPKDLIFVGLRVAIGLFFLIISGHVLLQPYQNFLYVIQGYDFLPGPLAVLAAYLVPWIEFFLGGFLALGLWLRPVLYAYMGLTTAFILVLAQALWRRLPLADCGCFGDLISSPLHVTIIFDLALLGCLVLLWRFADRTARWGLDRYFARQAAE